MDYSRHEGPRPWSWTYLCREWVIVHLWQTRDCIKMTMIAKLRYLAPLTKNPLIRLPRCSNMKTCSMSSQRNQHGPRTRKRCESGVITRDFWELTMLTKAILEPFQYIMSSPGKEIRGKLIEAFNSWLDVPQDKLQVITKVVSMFHTASLM